MLEPWFSEFAGLSCSSAAARIASIFSAIVVIVLSKRSRYPVIIAPAQLWLRSGGSRSVNGLLNPKPVRLRREAGTHSMLDFKERI